jgi:hypothetical protein
MKRSGPSRHRPSLGMTTSGWPEILETAGRSIFRRLEFLPPRRKFEIETGGHVASEMSPEIEKGSHGALEMGPEIETGGHVASEMSPEIEKDGHVTMEKSSQTERRRETTLEESPKRKFLTFRLLDSSKRFLDDFPVE